MIFKFQNIENEKYKILWLKFQFSNKKNESDKIYLYKHFIIYLFDYKCFKLFYVD